MGPLRAQPHRDSGESLADHNSSRLRRDRLRAGLWTGLGAQKPGGQRGNVLAHGFAEQVVTGFAQLAMTANQQGVEAVAQVGRLAWRFTALDASVGNDRPNQMIPQVCDLL